MHESGHFLVCSLSCRIGRQKSEMVDPLLRNLGFCLNRPLDAVLPSSLSNLHEKILPLRKRSRSP